MSEKFSIEIITFIDKVCYRESLKSISYEMKEADLKTAIIQNWRQSEKSATEFVYSSVSKGLIYSNLIGSDSYVGLTKIGKRYSDVSKVLNFKLSKKLEKFGMIHA